MISLRYPKYRHNLGDEDVLHGRVENPYRQYLGA